LFTRTPFVDKAFVNLTKINNTSLGGHAFSSGIYNENLYWPDRAALVQPRRELQKGTSMTAFTELLEAEIPKLRRYARALARDAVRADDLVQNALLRAIAKQHLWQPGTDLRAWLFTILHHQNVNDVRRSLREGDRVAVENVAPTLATVSDPTAALQIRDLERAIAALPEEQRQVLLLVGLEGMRYEEVATILEIPVGTVRSRLSRGRETLRRLMDMRGRADVNRGSPACKAAHPIASEGAAISAFSRLGRDLRREMRRKLPRDGRSGAALSHLIGFAGTPTRGRRPDSTGGFTLGHRSIHVHHPANEHVRRGSVPSSNGSIQKARQE
jgi:RNA polymerase sigma-70 factor (ECF subfamily)